MGPLAAATRTPTPKCGPASQRLFRRYAKATKNTSAIGLRGSNSWRSPQSKRPLLGVYLIVAEREGLTSPLRGSSVSRRAAALGSNRPVDAYAKATQKNTSAIV